MKESIIKYIMEIDELIKKCENITYKTIADNYINIKDNFNPVNTLKNKELESLPLEKYKEEKEEKNYIIETNVENYIIDNQFILDILFEDDDIKKPKIVGKVINKNKPKSFVINFYSKSGQSGKLGRKINVEFNNISSSIDINFDGGLNDAIINTNFSYEEYNIHTKFYETIENTQIIVIGGIQFEIPGISIEKDIDPPENEKELEVVKSKTKNKTESYSY